MNREPKVDLHRFFSQYDDRKMMKWSGFMMSEHTEDIKNKTNARNFRTVRLKEMNEYEMFSVYQQAIKKGSSVSIQENKLNSDSKPSPIITGKIKGVTDDGIYIEDTYIHFNDIKHIEITEQRKWSEVTK